MRRVNLDHAEAEAQDVLDVRHNVGGVPRMQAATGDQSLGIVLRVVGDELIDRGRKPEHLRRNVVDQCGTVNAATVQILEEGLGRAAIFVNLIEIGALALDQFQRMRLDEFNRLDVDMAVSNQNSSQFSVVSSQLDRFVLSALSGPALARGSELAAQYNGTFGSTVRAQ